MKALVIGYGSIGARHARVLAEQGADVAVVSRRQIDHEPSFRTIEDALQAFAPTYVVVASKTIEHHGDIESLRRGGFRGRLLVEKPVYDSGSENLPEGFEAVKVAFNLRFHPALQRFRALVAARRVYAVTVYCGSYLPGWRPNSDYRSGYSAIRAEGGGVLRDLSHELDYTLWLFGAWRRIAAIGGRFGNLEIDSDDVFSMLIETDNVPSVSVGINYLDSQTRREVTAMTDTGTLRLDLVRGILETPEGIGHFDIERDDTYRAQHTAMSTGDDTIICDITEGLQVMRLIDAAERAAISGKWMAA